MNCHSSYLHTALDVNLVNQTIDNIIKLLTDIIGFNNFDTLAFTGMSGALVAPIISYKIKKPLLMIRKEKDDSHSAFKVEGNIYAKKIVIVDDCYADGNTIIRMEDVINVLPKLTKLTDFIIPEIVCAVFYRMGYIKNNIFSNLNVLGFRCYTDDNEICTEWSPINKNYPNKQLTSD